MNSCRIGANWSATGGFSLNRRNRRRKINRSSLCEWRTNLSTVHRWNSAFPIRESNFKTLHLDPISLFDHLLRPLQKASFSKSKTGRHSFHWNKDYIFSFVFLRRYMNWLLFVPIGLRFRPEKLTRIHLSHGSIWNVARLLTARNDRVTSSSVQAMYGHFVGATVPRIQSYMTENGQCVTDASSGPSVPYVFFTSSQIKKTRPIV